MDLLVNYINFYA